MPTPLQFMNQYRNLSVKVLHEDVQPTPEERIRFNHHLDPEIIFRSECIRIAESYKKVQLRKYFLMKWKDDTEERKDYNLVTRGSRRNEWFKEHQEKIKNAAMGKGSPTDYELALEWAVLSGKIKVVNEVSLQRFCDNHLGIDCSGFVTNYLISIGKKNKSDKVVRNTSAASYFNIKKAINDPKEIRQGDLLVWMSGNSVKRNPGHVAVVESVPTKIPEVNALRVVEATGNRKANPKLLDSIYAIEDVIEKKGHTPMILKVKRHGKSGNRVVVIRL